MYWIKSRAAMLAAIVLAAAASTAGGLAPMLAPAAHAESAIVGVGTPTDRFTPNITTIHVGDTVTFNWTAGFHVVDLKDVSPDIQMDSTHTTGTTMPFNTAGTFYYYCSVHATEAQATEAHVQANDAMVGKIVVLPNAATATATATNPGATTTATGTATSTSTPAGSGASQTATGGATVGAPSTGSGAHGSGSPTDGPLFIVLGGLVAALGLGAGLVVLQSKMRA